MAKSCAGAYALALGLMMAASPARAQIPLPPIVSVYGPNTGVVLGPANGNVVVDIQFSLSREFNNVSIAAPLLGGSSNSVADFYLTTQVGLGTTSANAIAANTGYALAFGSQYMFTTVFSGLDLKAGTYNFVCAGSSGSPTLGYTYPPNPNLDWVTPGVSYNYSSTQSGASYAPASTLSPSGVAFNFEVTGNPVLLVGSAAGASSVVVPYAGWSVTSNSSFLHGSSGTTLSSVAPFTYDAFTGTGTRTGTLTIGGIYTVTVVQAGANYIGPGPVVTLVSSGLNFPETVAVDGAGNVYIADTLNYAIKEWSALTQQVTTLVSSGLDNPNGVAVDGAGNVYIADTVNSAIKEWNASTQQVTPLVSTGLSFPNDVAVGSSGNVYIADSGNDAIKEWGASTEQVTTLVSSGLDHPSPIAVDASGNVYIADGDNDAIKEWSASTHQVTTLASSGPSAQFQGVAVDASGNVYISDLANQAIEEWSASTQQVTTVLATGLNYPRGLAVDGAGNLYITDMNNNVIKELPYAFVGPASLTEPASAGSDSLLQVLPSTAPLSGIFAPTTDQSWLTIGPIVNGVVSFSVDQNASTSPRVAHIAILGQQLTVTQLVSQTITFPALGNVNLGAAPIILNATASSGLTVTFTSTTPSVCTLSGNMLMIVAVGACSVTANQAGNATYSAAPSVTQSFTVNPCGPSFGALTASSTAALPGASFSIPVTLALNSAISVDALTFGLQITPNASAPALTGALNFTPAAAITDAPLIATAGTSNDISVLWSSLSSPLTGTVILGTVTGTLPAGAAIGQSYAVAVTGVNAATSAGTVPVTVSPGVNASINVALTYLVGDVAPYTSGWSPNFGDGQLSIQDLIQALFAVNNVPGFRPATCSDRFDAMDTFPADTATVRGGDGGLDIRDLIEELFRTDNLDMSRPVRIALAGALPWAACTSASSGNSVRSTAAPAAQGALTLGHPQQLAAAQERIPVYLNANQDLLHVALTFALGDRQSQLRFQPTAATSPSLTQDSQPGVVAVAWLNGLSVRSGERLLLGYVSGPAGFSANLKFYGLSATALDDNRAVPLDPPSPHGFAQ